METTEAVKRLRAGDSGEPWAVLYQQFYPVIHKLAAAILRNDTDAEDVASRIMARLPNRIQNYDPAAGPFEHWLRMTTVGAAINHIKATTRAYEVIYERSKITRCTALENQDNTENQIGLNELIVQLDPDSQALIRDYLDGYLVTEMAQRRGEARQIVRRKINRVTARLQHMAKGV